MPRRPSSTAVPKLSQTEAQGIKCRLCYGEHAITVAQAKSLLGWREVAEGGDFKDQKGNAITLDRNQTNRPITWTTVWTLVQEILRKNWKANGETIIVGENHNILDGQHTLIALVLASQEWSEEPEWKDTWPEEPTVEKAIMFGISEDPDTVNTLNTGKPRTLADVIFRGDWFSDIPKTQRKAFARSCDYAVRLLWHRTGASADAFAPRRTHAESAAFIERHPGIRDAVRYIHEENDKNRIGRFISTGYAAGLLYLMSCASTKPEEYREYQDPDESMLDFSLLDKAQAFWTELAEGTKLAPLRKALIEHYNERGGRVEEKCALIVKAWLTYVEGKKVTAESLTLQWVTDDVGIKSLAEIPKVGGIDVGQVAPKGSRAAISEAEGTPVEDTSDPSLVSVGEEVWVIDSEGGGHWRGKWMSSYDGPKGTVAKVRVAEGYSGAGKVYDVLVSQLQSRLPDSVT